MVSFRGGWDSGRMNAMRVSRPGGVSALLAGALAGVLATSGCGQERSGDRPGGTGTTTAADGQSGSRGATVTEVKVNRSYWYAGFKVTLGAARLVPSAGSGGDRAPVVLIDATFQNLSSEDDAAPTEDLLLTSGTESYNELSDEHAELPEVPAQRSRTGVIAIEVGERFSLPDAVLTVGAPRSRQAVVPLARPDGLISLEPRPIKVGGRVYPDGRTDVFMTVTGGEVRADDPADHAQAADGHEYLMLSFTATNNGPAGMTYVFDRDLILILPDGTEVGHATFCSRAQVHVESHSTVKPEGPACFAVPVPVAGAYRFVWGEKKSKALRFSIS
jgi:hypothetical protein